MAYRGIAVAFVAANTGCVLRADKDLLCVISIPFALPAEGAVNAAVRDLLAGASGAVKTRPVFVAWATARLKPFRPDP